MAVTVLFPGHVEGRVQVREDSVSEPQQIGGKFVPYLVAGLGPRAQIVPTLENGGEWKDDMRTWFCAALRLNCPWMRSGARDENISKLQSL